MTSSRYLSLALLAVVASSSTMVQAQYPYSGEAAQNAVADHEDSDYMVSSTLEQIHVITRHGARTMLSRDADTLAEASGVTLTPVGIAQLKSLGTWLRKTYAGVLGINQDINSLGYRAANQTAGEKGSWVFSEGRDVSSLDYYNPNLHRFEASDLDRTLTSANALTQTLFGMDDPESDKYMRASGSHNLLPSDPTYKDYLIPSLAPFPIFTTGKGKNDITHRAYANCPTFHKRVRDKLYKSKKWKQLEAENQDLLMKLANWFPAHATDGVVQLKNIWNVYDALHVARTECVETQGDLTENSCKAFVSYDSVVTAATMLTTEEFEEIEKLAEHAEFLKFGAGIDTDPSDGVVTAGNLLGSNLLWKILNRSQDDGDFFLYSAHQATLMGLLATLQASKDFWNISNKKFFDYGSALIVEIHRSTGKGKQYFVLKYKDQNIDTPLNIHLKESETGVRCGQDYPGYDAIPKANWCTVDEVIIWAEKNTLTSEEQWCKACNNQEADVCRATGKKSGTSALDAWVASSESMGYTQAPGATMIICSLFFGGFAAGVLMMGLLWRFNSGSTRSHTTDGKNISVDASTSSYDGEEESPVIIESEGIFSNARDYVSSVRDDSAEKLNDKELC